MRSRIRKEMVHLVVSAALACAAAPAPAAEAPQVTVAGALTAPLAAPGRIALDQAGTIYVADVQNRGVVAFDGSGRFLYRIEVPGVVRAVAFSGGRLLISHDREVTMYGTTGTRLGSLTGYAFQLPSGIASDPSGNIYVADSKGNRVAAFAPTGEFRHAFGASGSQAGAFNFPTSIAYEKGSGQLAVADTLNNRVQFFETSGRFMRAIGSPAAPPGPLSFTYPQGIAFDYAGGTRMYVADTFQSALKVIDLSGSPRYLGTIGSYGSALGELMQPADVVADPAQKRLLVADGAGRVTVFGVDAAAGSGAALGAGLLDPVPAVVSTRTLILSGNVATGGRVAVSVGGAAATAASVQGARWSAVASLVPGENLLRVSANWTGGSDAVTVAVRCTAAQEGGGAGLAPAAGLPSGGSAPAPEGGETPQWSYPGGGDCHHAKGGGLVCKER